LTWGEDEQFMYCHGSIKQEEKLPQDGCAYLWNVWGGISYYGEMIFLISKGMKAPDHWTVDDWRVATSISNEFERISYEEKGLNGNQQ
jgi:hypothetical protein